MIRRQPIKPLVKTIVVLLIWGIISAALSGCAQATKLRISGVGRDKVAKAFELSPEDINKSSAVVVKKYLIHISPPSWSDGGIRKGKETIRIVNEDADHVVISLTCEFEASYGLDSLLGRYYRDSEREQNVLLGAVRQLEKENNANVEWLGDWKPATTPIMVPNGQAQ